MLDLWPSFSLFVLLLVLLIELRLLGGRWTLGTGRLMLSFSFGAAGAAILIIAAQRLALIFLSNDTAAWTTGPPLEELGKALPVLLLAYGFSARRRLTVADYALIGIASGLGFEFAEGNFWTVLGEEHPGTGQLWLQGVGALRYNGQVYWVASHAFWTGLVGLGAGIGIRLWPNSARRFIPAIAAATLVWFEHTMYNWKGTHVETLFGQIEGIARAPEWVEAIYAIDLHGLWTIILLPTGLLVATIIEGMWCRAPLADRRELMLPDEGRRPLVLREWIVLMRAIPRGRADFMRIARYFRRRRELMLASAELARHFGASELKAAADYLLRLVSQERSELDVPMPSRWLPAPGEVVRAIFGIMRRNWITFTVLGLSVLVFMVKPNSLPGWLHSVLFGRIFNALLIVLAALLLAWRVRAFRLRGLPDPERSNGEILVNYRLRILLLSASAVSLCFGVIAWFLSRNNLSPGSVAYITNGWDEWLRRGGGPVLPTVGTLLGTALADPNNRDPCDDLRREAASGAARINDLEQLAKNWKRPQPPPGGWPDRLPADPTAPMLSTDSWLNRLAGTALGQRIMTLCKPIFGPGGELIGLGMGVGEASDAPGSTDSPTTINLPGGRRLHVDPIDEWLTGKSTAQQALDDERKLQQQRLAALAGCEEVGGHTREKDPGVPQTKENQIPPPPPVVSDPVPQTTAKDGSDPTTRVDDPTGGTGTAPQTKAKDGFDPAKQRDGPLPQTQEKQADPVPQTKAKDGADPTEQKGDPVPQSKDKGGPVPQTKEKGPVQPPPHDDKQTDVPRTEERNGQPPLTKDKDILVPPPPGGHTRERIPSGPVPQTTELHHQLDLAKKHFEDLERQLHEAVGGDLEAIKKFLVEYDKRWKQALVPLNDYLKLYQTLIPAIKELMQPFVNREQALKYAKLADQTYQMVGPILGPEFLPGGAFAAEGGALAGAATTEGEVAAGTLARDEAAAARTAVTTTEAIEGEEAAAVTKGLEPGETAVPSTIASDPAATAPSSATSIDPNFPIRDKSWGVRMADAQPPINSQSQWAINGYTASDFAGINSALRAGDPGKWANAVTAIDNTMAPISEPVTVFRSTGLRSLGDAATNPSSLVGKVISDEGYTSTTLLNQANIQTGAVKLEIECAAGTPGRYIAPLSNVPEEQEVLLARNTQMAVQSVTQSPPGYPPGVWVIKARVVLP
jgi:RsiW-degrading membrane proteinase PrsW (M82 family)